MENYDQETKNEEKATKPYPVEGLEVPDLRSVSKTEIACRNVVCYLAAIQEFQPLLPVRVLHTLRAIAMLSAHVPLLMLGHGPVIVERKEEISNTASGNQNQMRGCCERVFLGCYEEERYQEWKQTTRVAHII